MYEGLKRLPHSELQAFIGEELLGRLESLLPSVSAGNIEEENIYSRETLASVVDSFAGDRLMAEKSNRRKILSYQPPNVIDRIIFRTDTQCENDTFEGKREALLARGWSDPVFAKIVLEELGLSTAHAPTIKSEIPSFETVAGPTTPFKSLKDYQLSVFLKAKEQLEIPRNRFIIQMPTGSGKTRTAMEILTDFLNTCDDNEVVVWLAHSAELCEQAHAAFKEVWEHIGEMDVSLVRMWGSEASSSVSVAGPAVVIGSFQKTYSLMKKNKANLSSDAKNVGLIVVDEAHKAIAPTYKSTIEALRGDDTRVVGLTATPGRSAVDRAENERLSRFFFGKTIEIDAPDEEGVIEHLRRRGVLSRAEYNQIITNSSFALSSKERKNLENFFDFPAGFLERVGNDDVRNFEIIRRALSEVERGSQILLFACSVEHSKFLCGCFTFLGVNAEHIDGSVGYSKRQKVIDDFKTGTVDVLTNYGVLSTGFDVPKVDVIFIVRPTASIVLYSQMIGRGLRGPAIGGTPYCRIVDVKDNIEGYEDADAVYEYFEEYWN